jgi:hypothetical protein
MELTPRTYRFLHVNGIAMLMFFFAFSLMVFVLYFRSSAGEDLQLLSAILLFVCGLIVMSLHWTLIQGLKTGVIVVRERGTLARKPF